MGRIAQLFDRIKHFFGIEKSTFNSSRPVIEIRERHDSVSMQRDYETDTYPRIKIGRVNSRISLAEATSTSQGEIDVQNSQLGKGITVKKQHKPGRCPLCATNGRVVANTAGGNRWRCEVCDSTFN